MVNSIPSHGIVHEWFMEFRCNCNSTARDRDLPLSRGQPFSFQDFTPGWNNRKSVEHSGRLTEIMTEEMAVNNIHDIVLENRRVKVHQIAKKVGSGGMEWL